MFYAFDLLAQDGEDLTRLPLIDRKARVEAMLQRLPAGSPIQYSWHVTDGAALFQAMRDNGLEGVVAKRAGSVYVPGDRSDSWLKIKTTQRQEFVVIGWRPPEFGPDDVRGLFLATYEDGKLVYRGGVGTGFTDRMRRQTLQVLQLIRREERLTVKGMPRVEARVCHWVEPRLLAEVEFTEITPDGVVRHPSSRGCVKTRRRPTFTSRRRPEMRRPTIPPKPAAPSIRQHIGPAVQRSRKVTRKLRPDEQPASRSELVEDIGRKLPLSPTLLTLMRERAREQND